jgi:aspartyl-tRNA synthetase
MPSQGLRSHTCGELRAEDAGRVVALSGWVDSCRAMGDALVFVDLRDKHGITQVAFDDGVDAGLRAAAHGLKPESVIHVSGTVRARPEGQANRDRATGAVEVLASTPPFDLHAAEESAVSDELRLQYRYLDLRRAAPQRNLSLRHQVVLALRNDLSEQGFVEVETPILTKATPEGARDYLVPSRVHRGRFYALPQSPQIFKQILMVAGVDRYFQVCRCFRDEDLRADRQPEFTQLDLEMSFVDEAHVIELVSSAVARAVAAVRPGDEPKLPLPVMTWAHALERYGSDKPDLRFGLELADVTEAVRGSAFTVFARAVAAGGRVRALAVPGGVAALSRKDIERLEAVAREHGAKGLAWARLGSGGSEFPVKECDFPLTDDRFPLFDGGFSKFVADDEKRALCAATGAKVGDLLLAVADTFGVSAAALSAVRLAVGRRLELIDASALRFTWVVDFPMFERDEETGALAPAHHPFCMPREESEGQLERDPGATPARSYDLVLNGIELGSGSVRIHDSALQERVFRAIGLQQAEIEERFGFVLEAFRYGAPPHAGFAVGLDRLVMILAGEDSIREVIAFPKTATAACLMTGAPTAVPAAQLAEAGVAVLPPSGGRAPGGAALEAGR